MAPPRAQPVQAFTYTSLAGDIRTLAVLAPAMIVLLLVAFFVFR